MEEALVEMCLAGVSARRAEDTAEALWETWVSSGWRSYSRSCFCERYIEFRQRLRGFRTMQTRGGYVMRVGAFRYAILFTCARTSSTSAADRLRCRPLEQPTAVLRRH